MPEFTLENTIFTLTSQYDGKGIDDAIKDLDKLDDKVDQVFNTIIKQQLAKTGQVAKSELDKISKEVADSFKNQGKEFTEFYTNLQKQGLKITEQEAKAVFDKVNTGIKNTLDRQKALQDKANADKKRAFFEEATNYKAHADKLAAIDKDFAATRKKLLASGLKLTDKEILDTFNNIKSVQQSQQNELARAVNQNTGLFGQIKNAAGNQLQSLGIDPTKLRAVGVAGAAALAPLAAAYGAFKLSEFAEQQELVISKFETLSGNRGLAIQLAGDLDELANKTGISGERLEDAASALLKFNVPASEIPKRLKELSGIAAATGTSLEALADKFGLITQRGFATTRDLKSFEREGLPIYESLSAATGKTVAELRKLKQVSDEDVTKAFQEMTKEGSKFSIALDKQASTLSGLKNRLKETFGNLLEDIGSPFLTFSKNILEGAISILDGITPYLKRFASNVGGVLSVLSEEFKNGFAGIRTEISGDLTTTFKQIENSVGKETFDKFKFGGEFQEEGVKLRSEISRIILENNKLDKSISFFKAREEIVKTRKELEDLRKTQANLSSQKIDVVRFASNKIQDVISTEQKQNASQQDIEINIDTQADALKKLKENRTKLIEEVNKTNKELAERVNEISIKGLVDENAVKDQAAVFDLIKKLTDEFDNRTKQVDELNKKIGDFNKNRGKLDPILLPLGIEVNYGEIGKDIQEALVKIPNLLNVPQIDILKTNVTTPKSNLPNELIEQRRLSLLSEQQLAKENQELEDQLAEQRKARITELRDITIDNAKEAADILIQLEIDKADAAIDAQKRRIDEVNKLAALGNAEQLQAEEDKLNELNARKEKYVERQRALAAIEIAATNAVTIANLAASIAKDSFTKDPIIAILNAVALAATIGATIAGIKAQLQANSFSEGKNRVQGEGTRKSDSIFARLSVDEGVLDAETNEKMDFADNKTKLRRYTLGKQLEQYNYTMPKYKLSEPFIQYAMGTPSLENKIDKTNKLLGQLVDKRETNTIHVTASLDKNIRDAMFMRKAIDI